MSDTKALAYLKLIFFSYLKGALSDLGQFVATESPSKIMKNAFYVSLKALFVLKIFKFLSSLFSQDKKRLELRDKINSNIYNVTTWLAKNYNTHIA